MGEKPSFPKVNLKYANLEVFAKAVRKSFGQGRLLVRLKKQFEPNQRLLLIFQIGDRDQPVEIIGQIIDRIEDKQKGGFAYGVRFLNFTENKLNRLLAGEVLKPTQAKPEIIKEPEKTAPAKETPTPAKPQATHPQETPEPAPEISKPSLIEREKAPGLEEIEIEFTVQAGAVQSFDGKLIEPEKKAVEQAKAPEPEQVMLEKEIPASEPVMSREQTEAQPSQEHPKIEAEKEHPQLEPTTIATAPQEPMPAPSPESTEAKPCPEPEKIEAEKEQGAPEPVAHPTVEPSAPAPQEPLAPPTQAKEEFQLTPPEALSADVELEAEPVTEETIHPATGPSLFDYIPAFKAESPDVFVKESSPKSIERTERASEEPVPLEELSTDSASASMPEPEAEQLAEIDEFSPTPEILKEAKPIPKIEPMRSATAAKASADGLAGPEEEIVELTGEVAPEEKPLAPAVPESRLPAVEPVSEFKPIAPEKLSDFLFRFCRLILNPPNPEQPDFQKQFQGLFDDFQKLMESRDRIGIYLVLSASGKDFIIEGAQASPKSIRILLPQDQIGSLIFRMIDLFDQKELVGIVFRKYLNLEHFQNFILTLGQFNPEKQSPDELSLKLIRAGIYHFNLIFDTDLIAVPERIKEETKIVLARLSGELKRLTPLSEQISEEPLALLTLRLEDIIRPIADYEVIAQILEHLPLIWTGQIQEFEYQDLEDQILFSIPVPILIKSSEILFKKLIQIKDTKDSQASAKTNLERILRRMMARIAYEAPEQALETLSQLFDRQLIKYEELPEEIRDQVAASKLAQEFLKNPEEKIASLEKANEPASYSRLASQLIWSSIALLKKKEYKWAHKIFQTLVAHYQDKSPMFPDRPRLARESLKKLSEPFAIELLAKMLVEGKKEERELSAAMLYATGEACVKKLLILLEQSPDRNVRRLACEIIARIGSPAIPALIEKLNQPDIPWYLIRNLIMILAEIKSPALKDKINAYLKHSHPRVREEAIGYMLAIGEKQTEAILALMLKDPEPSVQRRALSAMSKLEKLSNTSLAALQEMLSSLVSTHLQSSSELLFCQTIEILGRSSVQKFPDGTDINDFLYELLEQAEPRGIFSKPKLALTNKMRIALIDIIGKRKISRAQKILLKLAKDKDEQIRKSAEKALELIGQT